jgi:hypothetical protein
MSKLVAFLSEVSTAVGAVVDKVLPIGVGYRTAVTAIAYSALGYGHALIPVAYAAYASVAHAVLGLALPAFAVASLFRVEPPTPAVK